MDIGLVFSIVSCMVKEEDFIRLSISPAAHRIAYTFAYSKSENYNKQTIRKDNGGRYVGFIGELITIKYLHQSGIKYDWQNRDPSIPNYDFDININNVRLEIKTKDRTVDPKLFYECSVADYNIQDCDFYIFNSLTRDKNLEFPYHSATLLGYMPKKEYMAKAYHRNKGDIDPSNGFPTPKACWNLPIKDLYPIKDLIDIIRL
jgi:hypothetical protein